MTINLSDYFDELRSMYESNDGDLENWEKEYPVLNEVIPLICDEISDNYTLVRPIGRGGAGVVSLVKDNKLKTSRALKIPRPLQKGRLESVKSEMNTLTQIIHENIIPIYSLGEITYKNSFYPYFIMGYIDEANDLTKTLDTILSKDVTTKEIDNIMRWLVIATRQVCSAISFLHNKDIIHFDIKPGNIFIDKDGKCILSDLGYAKSKTASNKEIDVGFTLFYAHPDLKEAYEEGKSSNRIVKSLSPRAFEKRWDIYALGRTILQILRLIDSKYSDIIYSNFHFSYLHLCACRMLDGHNLSADQVRIANLKKEQDQPQTFVETWHNLDRRAFAEEEMKYETISGVCLDLDKLTNAGWLDSSLPELNSFEPHRVQSSKGTPASFTYRVKKLVEHPIMSRLGSVFQLGLSRNVYPTASHTRLEHSLGVFRNCCEYVKSLFNDPYSPLFRQLIRKSEIKSLMIASLVHDIGHYPLAHEFEDLPEISRHEDYSIALLKNSKVDNDGHTLQQIIENKEWGWGANLDDVIELLEKEKKSLFTTKRLQMRILSSIMSGPVDIDKMDYLLRDSRSCYLPYGDIIDYERLVRNITLVSTNEPGSELNVEMGVYEKGQAAAESVTFARYLLYQTLYWHHTTRSIRTMIREVLRCCLSSKLKSKTFNTALSKLIGIDGAIRAISERDILVLLSKHADARGEKILSLLKCRKYYKRILTIHDEEPQERGKEKLIAKFRNVADDPAFQKEFQSAVKKEFVNLKGSFSTSSISSLIPERIDNTIEILSNETAILLDSPKPSLGGKASLRIVPEPQRLQRSYSERQETSARIAEVWAQVFHPLMSMAAKGRVYCHPDIRDTLMAVLSPKMLLDLLKVQL